MLCLRRPYSLYLKALEVKGGFAARRSPHHHTGSRLKAALCIAVGIKDAFTVTPPLVSRATSLRLPPHYSLFHTASLSLPPLFFQTHKLVMFHATQRTSPLALTRTRFLSCFFFFFRLLFVFFIARSFFPSVLQMKDGSGLCLQGFKRPF